MSQVDSRGIEGFGWPSELHEARGLGLMALPLSLPRRSRV